MSTKTTKQLTVTFFAEDFGLPKSVKLTEIDGVSCWFEAEGKKADSLQGLLNDLCDNPYPYPPFLYEKFQESGKIPGISEEILFSEIRRATNDEKIIGNPTRLLEKIYLEGLTLTFKIETSEILPKTSEVTETSGKEINLKKLSTGYLLLNNYLITDISDFIRAIGYILERKVSVSYHYNQIKIKFDHNDKSIIIDKPFENINEIDIDLIKKIARQIMFDDIISEETFVI